MTSPRIPGGQYTAVHQPDGTWTILDVPIFAEIPPGGRRNRQAIDREWLLLAVNAAKRRMRENYLAPLHIHHHDSGVPTQRAGFVLPKRVGTISVDGREMHAIFADLIGIPDHIFALIERGELPYRSVEVFDWSRPEIASLALLTDEVPFFKFELLTIGRKIESSPEFTRYPNAGPLVGLCEAGVGGAILFAFGRTQKMADEEKEKKDETPAAPTEEKQQAEEEEKKKPEEKEEELSFEDFAREYLKCIRKHAEGLVKHFGVKLDEDGGGIKIEIKPKEAENREDESKGGAPTPVEQPAPKSDKASEGADKIKLAELNGEIAALRMQLARKQEEDKIEAKFAAAVERLREYALDDKTKASLRAVVAAGDKATEAFIAAFKANVAKDPPPTLESYESRKTTDEAKSNTAAAAPDDLAEFAKLGPDAMSKIRKFAADYEVLRSRTHLRMPLKRYIEIQLAASGVEMSKDLKNM